jgi:hypothetical protein
MVCTTVAQHNSATPVELFMNYAEKRQLHSNLLPKPFIFQVVAIAASEFFRTTTRLTLDTR